jgi:hypothetical protein
MVTGFYYFIQTVHVLTFHISSNICTLWYTIYGIYQLLHVSTQSCHLQGVIITQVYKPTCKSVFCSSYRNDEKIKMLKHIKPITMNYSIIGLNIKIRNYKPTQLSVLSIYIYIYTVYVWWMYTNICLHFIWSEKFWSRHTVRSVWYQAV